MNPITAVLIYRIFIRGELSDLDLHNYVVALLDDIIFRSLGLYIEDPKVYDIYEAIYTAMSLHDLVRWLHGEEIAINSITAYIVAVVAWMA